MIAFFIDYDQKITLYKSLAYCVVYKYINKNIDKFISKLYSKYKVIGGSMNYGYVLFN